MPDLLVDSSVLLDFFTDDPDWGDRSQRMLERYGATHSLWINDVIYSEVSIGFERIEDLEAALNGCGILLAPIPKEALFLAGKAFLLYRRRQGNKLLPLPDFFIGAHAAATKVALLTRDPSRVKAYFPSVHTVDPSGE
jgi:hypothetical protein